MQPYHRMRGMTEWIFPLLSIEIIPSSVSRGRKFDIAFYDEEIEDQIVQEVIRPCCNGSRPRPLKEFLWRFPAWRNTIIEEKQPQIYLNE